MDTSADYHIPRRRYNVCRETTVNHGAATPPPRPNLTKPDLFTKIDMPPRHPPR